jgi:adenosine deaminase
LQDFQDDGVVYLELRTTPRAIPAADPPVTKEMYIETVLSTIRSFASPTMNTKLILSIDRRNNLSQAMEVVSLARKYRDQGVVGIDLCGDPSAGPISIFTPAFALAQEEGIPITLHFAESPASSTEEELQTLLSWEPSRIGHVINVPDSIKDLIIKKRIGLELCLSCNVHAKMITGSYSDHHFGYWVGKGCPVILCVSLCRSTSYVINYMSSCMSSYLPSYASKL